MRKLLCLILTALLLCFALLAPQWASSHSQWVEEVYSQILYPAMGLLSAHYPQTALRIMKKELTYHGYPEQTDQ